MKSLEEMEKSDVIRVLVVKKDKHGDEHVVKIMSPEESFKKKKKSTQSKKKKKHPHQQDAVAFNIKDSKAMDILSDGLSNNKPHKAIKMQIDWYYNHSGEKLEQNAKKWFPIIDQVGWDILDRGLASKKTDEVIKLEIEYHNKYGGVLNG